MARSRITSAFVLTVLAATIGFQAIAVAEQPQRAGGAGWFELTCTDGQPGRDELAFSAVRHADGTVTGEAQQVFWCGNAIEFFSHLRIDCMAVLDDGRTVVLSGVIVLDSDPDFVGSPIIFAVRDNGEGAGAPPDEKTGIFAGLEIDCNDVVAAPDVFLAPISAGNYQVVP